MYPGGKSKPGMLLDAREPAGEGREEEEREQEARHEQRRRREHVVHDAPGNRERNRPEVSGHVLVNLLRMAQTEAVIESTAISNATSEAERERLRVPALDDQAPDGLDQVRDGVERRHDPEPVGLDQFPRQVHRRQEEPDEEEREEPLHRLARARLQSEEGAQRAERERDQGRQHEDHDDAERAGGDRHSGDQSDCEVEAGLEEAHRHDSGQVADDQRRAAHRGQRQPVQEARLDVAGQVGARVHRREERALDEGKGEEEREERIGRKPRQTASPRRDRPT